MVGLVRKFSVAKFRSLRSYNSRRVFDCSRRPTHRARVTKRATRLERRASPRHARAFSRRPAIVTAKLCDETKPALLPPGNRRTSRPTEIGQRASRDGIGVLAPGRLRHTAVRRRARSCPGHRAPHRDCAIVEYAYGIAGRMPQRRRRPDGCRRAASSLRRRNRRVAKTIEKLRAGGG